MSSSSKTAIINKYSSLSTTGLTPTDVSRVNLLKKEGASYGIVKEAISTSKYNLMQGQSISSLDTENTGLKGKKRKSLFNNGGSTIMGN